MSFSLKFNKDLCTGCLACVVACGRRKANTNAPSGRYVLKKQNIKEGTYSFLSIACLHCKEAKCILSCPRDVYYRDGHTGAVNYEVEKCIGCKQCLAVCPIGAIAFDQETNKVVKCDMCSMRIKEGKLPLCVQTCPAGAISLVEVV